MIALGATDADLADFFDVTEKTINNWKKKHPEFLQSLKEAKGEFDTQVENSLAIKAKGGYETTETRIKTDCDDKVISTVTVQKTLAPDPVSAIFWLKNRQPERWRDKPEEKGGNEIFAEAMSKLEDKLPD